MTDERSLNHSVWECKYHIVWIPKYRRKRLYGQISKHPGEIFQELARHKENRIEEGHVCPDHIHTLIAIPPKYSVAQVVGYIKGKSAIAIAGKQGGRKRNFTGESFWARGYYVSTVGRNEEAIRRCIREQEAEGNQLEQREMFSER